MVLRIRHVGLVVQNLEQSLHFWCNILGFRVFKRLEEEGTTLDNMIGLKSTKLTTVKLIAPDENLLELLHFHSHRDKEFSNIKPYSTGFTHIALTVKDIEHTFERIKAFYEQFSYQPQISDDGKVKMIYAQGPEGVLIELVEELK